MNKTLLLLPILAASLLVSCRESHQHDHATKPHQHEHTPPHGGTPVVLGDEKYHLELVLDAASGKLQAYVLDGHMDQFVRLTNSSFNVSARLGDKTETLVFHAVAVTATGEKVGDTALFESQAEWLKTAKTFDGQLEGLTIRGKYFQKTAFNFPKGNESNRAH